jgi:hypothetical protein
LPLDNQDGIYVPYLNRWSQPDTIVPNPFNPQTLNRYSYGNNNPLIFVDPSGHAAVYNQPCPDGICDITAFKLEAYTSALDYYYGWNLEGEWELDEVMEVWDTAQEIEEYVDKLTGGKGKEWMKEQLGDTDIKHRGPGEHPFLSDVPENYSNTMPWWTGLENNTIYLSENWTDEVLIHEFGHIWDINTGYPSLVGVVGGLADGLNGFINTVSPSAAGAVRFSGACRYCQNGTVSPYIPESYQFDSRHPYGNNATADYFAEAFRWSVVSPNVVPRPEVKSWIEAVIVLQANSMP